MMVECVTKSEMGKSRREGGDRFVECVTKGEMFERGGEFLD